MPLSLKYIFIFLFVSIQGMSQDFTSLSIYYASNVYSLNTAQQKSIDSLLDSHAFEAIELIGFADTVGNKKANLKISKLRAEQIRLYIHSKISTANIASSANGDQDKKNARNDLKEQRRVDIILMLTSIETIEISQENIKEINQQNSKVLLAKEELSPKRLFKENLLNNDKIIIENLLFESGKTTFLYDKVPNELYYLADLMDSIQSLEIKIEGHVCCVNDKKLSSERAKTVYLFLRGMGIDKQRIQYEGFSNSRPLIEEKTAEDQKLNRRVEILVTQK